MSTPFPYESSQIVPWKYTPRVKQYSLDVSDIARIGGMTHSGRIYLPTDSRREKPSEERPSTIAKKAKVTEKEYETRKEEEENVKFLKFISQSEYELMDQLKQTPANISL
ncbi:hypothetical protein CR513_11563, partial [Mucuna pruriens]